MGNYYATKSWKSLRDSVLKRDDYQCQRCGSTSQLLAHHKIPREDGGPDVEDNLKTVCKPCHILEHADYSKSKGTGKYNPTDEELVGMGLVF